MPVTEPTVFTSHQLSEKYRRWWHGKFLCNVSMRNILRQLYLYVVIYTSYVYIVVENKLMT